MSYQRILLVVEGNATNQPAVLRALEFSSAQTEVQVFHPVYNSRLASFPASAEAVYERLRSILVDQRLGDAQKVADFLRAKKVHAKAAASWDTPVYEAIIRQAVEFRADIVVTGTLDSESRMSHEDWRLVGLCPVPLLIVKTDATYRHIVAAVDPMHAHGKPAELDDRIVATAKVVAREHQAGLKVLHCYMPITHAIPLGGEHLPIDDVETTLEEDRRKGVEQLVSAHGLPMEAGDILEGPVARVLERLVQKDEADLVVMGGLSRGRIRDFVIGNTAEQLLKRTDVDFLVVKPKGFETKVRKAIPADPLGPMMPYPPF